LLAGGGISDEAKGVIMLATTRRIRGCLKFGFYRRLPTVVTCTAGGSEVAVKLRQRRAPIVPPKLGMSFTVSR
jgi:hypothetical protein